MLFSSLWYEISRENLGKWLTQKIIHWYVYIEPIMTNPMKIFTPFYIFFLNYGEKKLSTTMPSSKLPALLYKKQVTKIRELLSNYWVPKWTNFIAINLRLNHCNAMAISFEALLIATNLTKLTSKSHLSMVILKHFSKLRLKVVLKPVLFWSLR